MDLGGGLNTRLDPHALARNELAVSINLWPSYDSAVAKRPGSNPFPGATVGSGHPGLALVGCRFNGATYAIKMDTNRVLWARNVDASDVWTQIGTVNAQTQFITAAQMFDPTLLAQAVFICSGFDVPQYWLGPGHVLANVATSAGHLPSKFNAPGSPLTPQFVKTLGNNSHLFYSGDSSNTSAVYISDPFYPQNFNNAAMQVTTDPTVGAYQPAIVGNNDGVDGGNITGMESLGSVMVVFKEAAVYTMNQTTLLGEVPAWQVVEVSNAVGCLAPRSIVRFTTFIVFLGIDGVYITDANGVEEISEDVSTYFDSSLTGFAATCTNRTISQAVRHGMRYEIWFSTANKTYVDTGLWFDFSKQSRFGNPVAGQISGMTPGGLIGLRSPSDDGNVAWVDSQVDREGIFGQSHGDLPATPGGAATAITTTLAGKADLFDDVFGPEATVAEKVAQDAYLLVAVLNQVSPTQISFTGSVIVDLSLSLAQVLPSPIGVGLSGGMWGSGRWGTMIWSAASGTNFALAKIPLQSKARGHLFQVGISESSTVAWVIIGYAVYVNLQKVSY